MPKIPQFSSENISERIPNADLAAQSNPVFTELADLGKTGIAIGTNLLEKQVKADALKYATDSFVSIGGAFQSDLETFKTKRPDGVSYSQAAEEARQKYLSRLRTEAPSDEAYEAALSRVGGVLERGALGAGVYEIQQKQEALKKSQDDMVGSMVSSISKSGDLGVVEEMLMVLDKNKLGMADIEGSPQDVSRIFNDHKKDVSRAFLDRLLRMADKAGFKTIEAILTGDNEVVKSLSPAERASYFNKIKETKSKISAEKMKNISDIIDAAKKNPSIINNSEVQSTINSLDTIGADSVAVARAKSEIGMAIQTGRIKELAFQTPVKFREERKKEIEEFPIGADNIEALANREKIREELEQQFRKADKQIRRNPMRFGVENDEMFARKSQLASSSPEQTDEFRRYAEAYYESMGLPKDKWSFATARDEEQMGLIRSAMYSKDPATAELAKVEFKNMAIRHGDNFVNVLKDGKFKGEDTATNLAALANFTGDERVLDSYFDILAKTVDTKAEYQKNTTWTTMDKNISNRINQSALIESISYIDSGRDSNVYSREEARKLKDLVMKKAQFLVVNEDMNEEKAADIAIREAEKAMGIIKTPNASLIVSDSDNRDIATRFTEAFSKQSISANNISLVKEFNLDERSVDSYINNNHMWVMSRDRKGITLMSGNPLKPVKQKNNNQPFVITFADMRKNETIIDAYLEKLNAVKVNKLQGLINTLEK